MKVLVAYFTQTGNTRKVAEAIYGEIDVEKEMREIGELTDMEGYDLVFYGFPIQAGNPAKDAGDFLKAQGEGKRIAVFVTHGAPEGAERVGPWLDIIRGLVPGVGAELMGLFDCQGEASRAIVDFLLGSDDPDMRRYGQEAAEAKGLPDEARLERARAFAREVIAKA
ncbi:MAG: flavodoxin family protein [Actinomycetota bacterium]